MSHIVVGDLIAHRYKLVRFVAQGGMGEVWEALDQTLGLRVALKMIRRDLLSRPVVMERLKRETNLARRVTHPNVCRLYDIGVHEEERSGDRLTFLTMEMLDGPTLEETIRNRGRLPVEAALPVALQMAEGLAAAHDAGVVHRDFKSANVVLVPSIHGPRVVITDFGLARSSLEDGTSLGLTSVDATVGTPAYMSPEQAEGLPAGPRSDVYSLGVVLYEMVTGRWPHSGPTPMSTLLRRLREPAPSPRALVPDLDPRWEAAILRCLALSPGGRFESAREVAAALTSADGPVALPAPDAAGPSSPTRTPIPPLTPTTTPTTPTVPLRALSRRGPLFLGLGVVFVLAVSGGLIWRARKSAPAGEAETLRSRKAVAVLGFKNLSQRPEAAWLSTALSEMLTAELSAGGALRTVPGESVARMRRDLSLPETDSFAPDTLQRIRGLLGADVVVAGSYLSVPGPSGEQLRLVVSVQDAKGGDAPRSVTQTGTVADVLALVSRAGARVRESLGATGPTAEETGKMQAAFTKSPEALRLYAEGLESLRDLDLGRARDTLIEAASADPENPLIHAALAQAWAALGYDSRAVSIAKEALALSSGLAREDRLFVEARAAEYSHDWEKAIESYRTLFGFFPDNLEYGLRLSDAQSKARRPAEALKTVLALQRLPSPTSLDLRIRIAEADAAVGLGDFRRARAAAELAVAEGTERGSRLLVAQAHYRLASALVRLGEGAAARTAAEASRRAFAAAGERSGEARATERLGAIDFEEGRYADADRRFGEALAVWRKVGNAAGIASALNNVASTRNLIGDLSGARPLFEEALALYREIDDATMQGLVLSNLASIAAQEGRLDRSRDLLAEAAKAVEPTGSAFVTGWIRYLGGRALLYGGRLEEAERELQAAVAGARAEGDKRLEALALAGLGEAAWLSGRVPDARARLGEATRLRREIGSRGEEAEGLLELGLLALDQGLPSEALKVLSDARATFARLGMLPREACAAAAMAGALDALGRSSDAEEALQGARVLVPRCQDVPMRLRTRTFLARASAFRGDAARAERDLEAVLRESRDAGLVPLECFARLELAAVRRSTGRAADALRDLDETRHRAHESGLVLIEARAGREREKSSR